ncbi:MAG TPA: hydroxymethylbilane synthase [Myxococcota bacterium]|nr:hydroxymethylbilane synthase [Myxococcota bacterium]
MKRLVLGTRGSKLALAQSRLVAGWLEQAHGIEVQLEVISTRGDRVQDRPLPEVGGKGLFTLELEQALRSGSIHLAVHSLKDLPTEDSDGLVIAAVPAREDPRDVLVGARLETLHPGAIVGTGSARRAAQLVEARPDVEVRGIRGNVDTRLRKLAEGDFDAVVLAAAGLSRLGLSVEGESLDVSVCTPAPGQGALGIQTAAGSVARALVEVLDDEETRVCVEAERNFLAVLEGGCSVPAGAFAWLEDDSIRMIAVLASATGLHRLEAFGDWDEGAEMGAGLAEMLRQQAERS